MMANQRTVMIALGGNALSPKSEAGTITQQFSHTKKSLKSVMHFVQHGGIWPTHCVADTQGAEFHRDLELPTEAVIISKGQSRSSDGYSAFDGCTLLGELFQNELAGRAIRTLYVTGLATDYCVRHSVLDALRTGLRVDVVTDAIAGVDRRPGDAQRALNEMHASGAQLTTAAQIEKKRSEINSL